jgi:hypothetical protein
MSVDTFVSQFGQDAFFFFNYFRCMDGPGTYLDLGAFDPRVISNTWFLDKCLGWRGICVEGDRVQAVPFRTNRSCHVVDKVLSMKAGTLNYVAAKYGSHVAAGGELGSEAAQSTTLARVLNETTWGRAPRVRIDFMSLDVEFHELEVLVGIPWDRIDLRFATIENNLHSLDTWEFLMRLGFIHVASIGQDEMFMRENGASAALWLPANIDALRIKESTYRRDAYRAATYQHEPLYAKGWSFLLQYAAENGELPT